MSEPDDFVDDEQAIKDAVTWWYRTQIKHPPDTVAEIAQETGESTEMIESWIAEAIHLLSQPPPEK